MSTNERHNWAAKVLNVQPNDMLLEIGCGAGITADIAAGNLTTGKLHALDRSEAMIRQASKRNRKWIDEGKMDFIQGTFGKTGLPLSRYDKIYAFNVSLFLKDSTQEFNLLKSLMDSKGRFYYFSQPPFDNSKDIVKEAADHFESQGFQVLKTEVAPFRPSPTFCVTASLSD